MNPFKFIFDDDECNLRREQQKLIKNKLKRLSFQWMTWKEDLSNLEERRQQEKAVAWFYTQNQEEEEAK